MRCMLKVTLREIIVKRPDLELMYWRDYKTYKSDDTKIKFIKSDVTKINFTKIIIMKKAYLEIGEGRSSNSGTPHYPNL